VTPWAWVAVVGAVVAVALALPGPRRLPGPPGVPPDPSPRPERSGGRRWWPLLCLLAGCAAALVVGGTGGWLAAPVVAWGCWLALTRAEPAAVRRRRAAVARDVPHLVELLAATLRAGADPADGLDTACRALPGPAADRLTAVRARLRLGVDPAEAWSTLTTDPALAPLGRALARSHSSGAPVVETVERLAEELERDARAAVEDRARAVGVRAALPLGLCLLPSFLLLGIVPSVAGLLGSLTAS
jgi:Flp pilus assembly protein TadB